jgi:hypothetical protein
MTDDQYLDETIRIAEIVIAPRALLIALIYLTSLLMIDVPFGKAFCVGAGIYTLIRLPLGRRHIDRFAFIFFIVAVSYWIEVAPLKRWTHSAVAAVDARIGSSIQTTAQAQ